jgi:predicted nucleic-acid-binding protein
MIGLDAHVLVRILAADDPVQTPHATQFLQDHCNSAEPGFVNCVVIIELLWVLENAYRFRREDIVRAIESLIENTNLAIEFSEQVQRALRAYQASNCDLVDALIGGCEATATFDRGAARLNGFIRIS